MTRELSEEATAEIQKPFREEFAPGRVARELALIAFADMRDYVQVDEAGAVKPLGFDDLKPDRSKVIKKIREKRKILQTKGESEDIVLEDTFEFELWDKLEALEFGAKLAGLEPAAKIEWGEKPILIISKRSNGGGNGESGA